MDIPTTLPGGPLGTVTGILLVAIGVISLVFPALVFSLFAVFFALFAIIMSLELIRSGISGPSEGTPCNTLQLALGLLGILAGILILVAPYFVSFAAKDIFGVWAILAGIGNLLAVFTAGSGIERAQNVLIGLILATCGVLILAAPALLADLILVIIIGFSAILAGIFSIWFARGGPAPEAPVNHLIYK